ncbi:hypothetical protein [Brytella acorum]|uniref:Uncharacterized protein n=1 Tax=Brytella acorum TaxID=2959299 RepID=A0AA35XVQ5_9PROT|nr:hypothetical protein [Brytella acorum]MDF3623593.1 hypothetical protein [Brytella acorum]CAI9119989.1 hypothetical protein LMG32879_000815 [Brytella acorum]
MRIRSEIWGPGFRWILVPQIGIGLNNAARRHERSVVKKPMALLGVIPTLPASQGRKPQDFIRKSQVVRYLADKNK